VSPDRPTAATICPFDADGLRATLTEPDAAHGLDVPGLWHSIDDRLTN
jgi:hypothetical protein